MADARRNHRVQWRETMSEITNPTDATEVKKFY
jgi:hypothetical protein